jgi:hypothetical protein
MQQYDDSLLEPLQVEAITVPVLRIASGPEVPATELQVGDQTYRYEKSFPSRGYAAVLPRFLNEQLAADRKPLLVERVKRYYVYFAAEAAKAEPETKTDG